MMQLGADANTIDRVGQELDRRGLFRFEQVVDPGWLAAARDEVGSYLAEHGHHYYFLDGSNASADGAVSAMAHDVTMRGLLDGLVRRANLTVGGGEDELIRATLNIYAGPVRENDPFCFHYDASIVTAIVPLIIPDNGPGNSGEFVIYPNKRPFRRTVAANILEKAATQNRLYRAHVARQYRRQPAGHTVAVQPGDIYLFWGYRGFHGNLPCAPGSVRATLILHYGNPHEGSSMLAAARALARLRLPPSRGSERRPQMVSVPSALMVQAGLTAISQTWPSRSAKYPE